jgi:hypothetical protein
MPLQLPKENLPALAKIIKLSDAEVDELINALTSSTIAAEARAMSEKVAGSVPTIPREDLDAIMETLYSLYHVREFSEVRPARFLRDLVDALLQNPDFGLKKTGDDPSHVGKRFQRLLDVKTLNVLSKAVRLQRDAERIYCGAKILSDIRSVFSDDISEGPISAVITHTLKIAYHQDGDHKEFFIVMDQQDLINLGETVERAHEKEEALTNLLKQLELPRLGI